MAAETAAETLLLDKSFEVPVTSRRPLSIVVSVSHRLSDVEAVWAMLAAGGIESPGQQIGFVRQWMDTLGVPEKDRFFVTAHIDGAPLALLALQRRLDKGVRVLSWFPGSHVGCNAPLVDGWRLAAMSSEERRQLWIGMLRRLSGADVVYLKSVPQVLVGGIDIFAELGQSIDADTLYRASFASFEEADSTQRNKSRRKHDRQQGDRLAALGTVEFAALDNGLEAVGMLDLMFNQRAARFREMGVADPFSMPAIRAFYDATAAADSGVPVKLHMLRLDGEVVAMRYNVAHGDRLFCLISSMSVDPRLQAGSPGKQCLLRVMQTVFAEGFRTFDMGEGLTDEKRHWCNVQVPVRHHYMPITRRGAIAGSAHRGLQTAKARIKSDPRLLGAAKAVRGWLQRAMQGPEPAPSPFAVE